jgi:DHA2 family multidrug resistance protein
MGVATLCDRMEAGGWIGRQPSPTDRRANTIALQPKAHSVLDDALAISDELHETALAGFTPRSASSSSRCCSACARTCDAGAGEMNAPPIDRLAPALGAEVPMSQAGDHRLIPHRGMITVSIMLATIMQALDTTIANVALPHMQGSLQSSQDQITWVLTSYIVAAAIATPLTGWLCSTWGRRKVFLATVLGFTVASALCGLAGSLWEIVAARLLQGLFGAALVPLSQAVLLDINPKEKIGQAMAIWGAGIMIGPILGPMLGGWLTENVDWRWVFFINLPVGVLAFYGIARYMPESRPEGMKFDMFGFATLSLAIGLLQLFLDRGEQLDWFDSTEIRIEAIGCVIAFAFFIAHTFTTNTASFLNLALLRDRNFVSGSVIAFVVGITLYATMALLPNLLQSLLGYPVVYTGMVMAPRGIGTMFAMLVVGQMLRHFDAAGSWRWALRSRRSPCG